MGPRATEGWRRWPRPTLSGAAAVSLIICGLGMIGWGAYIPVKAVVAQVLLERAFSKALAMSEAAARAGARGAAPGESSRQRRGADPVPAPEAVGGAVARIRPWSWADTWPVARLEVARLGERVIVLSGDSGQALAFGPGLVPGTALPGEAGVSVIAAHRDTHFDFLKEVKAGDRIGLTRADGSRHVFVARHSAIVRWDATGLDANAPGRWLVLATCWPFDATAPGPLRYVLIAEAESAAGI